MKTSGGGPQDLTCCTGEDKNDRRMGVNCSKEQTWQGIAFD